MLEIDSFVLITMLQQALLGISLYVPLMSGQLSLASPAFYTIGGYLAALLSSAVAKNYLPSGTEIYPWTWLLVELALAALLCFVLAYGMGRLVLRLRGIYLALATLALVEIVRVLCLNLEWTGGAIGIFSIPQIYAEQQSYLWLFFLLFVAVASGVVCLERSVHGQAFRALREDEFAGAAMGIDPARCKTLAFAFGAVIAGITGVASAHLLNTWNARQGNFDSSINLLAYVMIGGPWSVWGGVLGGMLLSALPELLRPLQDYRLVVNGSLIVLASLYLPKGLVPDRFWQRWMKDPERDFDPLWKPDPWNRVGSTDATKLLEIKALTVRFGGLVAVKDLQFDLQKGEIFGLIGPNGAGKTTVFNVLSGFVKASAGQVLFANIDITEWSVYHRARLGILRTFQNLRLLRQQSVLDNILSARHRFVSKGLGSLVQERHSARKEALYWLHFCGLKGQARRLAGDLNYGDQRRLEMARALMAHPEILLLDEPVAGMNLKEKSGMQQLILQLRDEFGITVVLIEHHVPLVLGLCDRIAVLNFGQLIALGSPAEIQNHPAVRAAYLGDDKELG